MHAAGAMAAFATYVLRVGPVRFEARMCGGGKMLNNFAVAFRAVLIPHELCARNFRRNNHHTIDGDAGNKNPQ